jgi:hypothetical protein
MFFYSANITHFICHAIAWLELLSYLQLVNLQTQITIPLKSRDDTSLATPPSHYFPNNKTHTPIPPSTSCPLVQLLLLLHCCYYYYYYYYYYYCYYYYHHHHNQSIRANIVVMSNHTIALAQYFCATKELLFAVHTTLILANEQPLIVGSGILCVSQRGLCMRSTGRGHVATPHLELAAGTVFL